MAKLAIPIERHVGKVKFYSAGGYGFICRENDTDVFLHPVELTKAGIDDVKPGDMLEFELKVMPTKRRPKAINIKVVTP